MKSILSQLEIYLKEGLNFPTVSVLSSQASLTYDLANQCYILDLPNTRPKSNYNQFDLYGFAVKDTKPEKAKELCQKIEYALDNLRIGRLLDKDDFTAFNKIENRQSATYLPSSQASSENTTIYQTNFEFIYQDFKFFKQIN